MSRFPEERHIYVKTFGLSREEQDDFKNDLKSADGVEAVYTELLESEFLDFQGFNVIAKAASFVAELASNALKERIKRWLDTHETEDETVRVEIYGPNGEVISIVKQNIVRKIDDR
jgi:hypothetical protein